MFCKAFLRAQVSVFFNMMLEAKCCLTVGSQIKKILLLPEEKKNISIIQSMIFLDNFMLFPYNQWLLIIETLW